MGSDREFKSVFGDLKALIRFYKGMGLEGYTKSVPLAAQDPQSEGEREGKGLRDINESSPYKEPLMAFSEASEILQSLPKGETLEQIIEDLGDCTRCELCEGRTNIVFGEGNPNARIVFVGEGPGADEDAQGRPFVGRAGKLLTKVINAMGFERDEVYICNIVKCRPPGNRNPETGEMETCGPFMYRQLRGISPEIVICLGAVAIHYVFQLQKKMSISAMRGRVHELGGMKLVATYHPAALLRNPNFKKPLWDDMKMALAAIGLEPPA